MAGAYAWGAGDGVLKLMARQPTGGTIDVAPGNKPYKSELAGLAIWRSQNTILEFLSGSASADAYEVLHVGNLGVAPPQYQVQDFLYPLLPKS